MELFDQISEVLGRKPVKINIWKKKFFPNKYNSKLFLHFKMLNYIGSFELTQEFKGAVCKT